jgi:hypothetical protein
MSGDNTYYEVGYTLSKPKLSFTFNDGTYKYGPEPTGVTLTSIAATYNGVNKTLSDFTVSGNNYSIIFDDVIISKEGSVLTELVDVNVNDVAIYLEEDIVIDTKALAFFENIDTENETERFVEEHEKGYNNEEYLNNTFPIDIEKAVTEPEKYQPIITIEEIEGDIFARPDAPVFNSVASQQSYDRYMAVEEVKEISTLDSIEKEIFGIDNDDVVDIEAITSELDANIALQDMLNEVDNLSE